jgi:large subunit ribosomal protein L10
MKKRSEKQEDLDKLKNKLATVSTVILSTFQGITVEDDNKLRRAVEQAGGHYQVVKNTLAERAASGTPIEPLLKNLAGTNSIAYTATDPVSLAKALTKIAKDVPAFQFRAGIVEGRVLSIAEIQQLSSLEGRIDQQDHVSRQRAGAANRLRAGCGQPQPGRHGQRSGEGQQVRTGFCTSTGRNGSIKNLICI